MEEIIAKRVSKTYPQDQEVKENQTKLVTLKPQAHPVNKCHLPHAVCLIIPTGKDFNRNGLPKFGRTALMCTENAEMVYANRPESVVIKRTTLFL
jgi:hypothetical protein